MPGKLQRCPRGAWTTLGRSLVVWTGGAVEYFEMVPAPNGARELFNEVFAAAALCCRPHFVWVADANGAGGFAMGDLVAIGVRDLNVIADNAWRRYFAHVPLESIPWYRAMYPTARITTRSAFRRAVAQFVIAHELGHVRQAEEGVVMSSLELEADADKFAGQIACRLGWDARLGRIIAHSIGCVGDYCDHPRPNGRVSWYDSGWLHEHGQHVAWNR